MHAEVAQDLTTCGACGCPFVQPVDWDEAGARHWRSRCAAPTASDCGTVVVEDEVVDHYDLELERGAAELARTLHEIVEENIEREAERLARCPRRRAPPARRLLARAGTQL